MADHYRVISRLVLQSAVKRFLLHVPDVTRVRSTSNTLGSEAVLLTEARMPGPGFKSIVCALTVEMHSLS